MEDAKVTSARKWNGASMPLSQPDTFRSPHAPTLSLMGFYNPITGIID